MAPLLDHFVCTSTEAPIAPVDKPNSPFLLRNGLYRVPPFVVCRAGGSNYRPMEHGDRVLFIAGFELVISLRDLVTR